jgi:hypothetical protein
MELLDYTEKSFVLHGEQTRDLTKQLKELGGKFNPNLTHPETGLKFAGWIFSKKQKEKIESLIHDSPIIQTPATTDAIDDLLDPIQRLGLADNGPDPIKKVRGKTIERSKTVHEPIVPKTQILQERELHQKDLLFDEIPEVSSQPPEIQEISFSMIVPKVGMKVKVCFEHLALVLKIVEVIKNEDGYSLEFVASKDGRQNYRFVMVGKNWRLLTTEIPHYLNFL